MKFKVKIEKLDEYQKRIKELEKNRNKKWDIEHTTYGKVKDKIKEAQNEYHAKIKKIREEQDQLNKEVGYYDIDFNEQEYRVLQRIIGKIKSKQRIVNGGK